MPELFVLRVVKTQAGEMGVWPAQGFRCTKLWSQEEASKISAFIPIIKSMARSAGTRPCGQLMLWERPAVLLPGFLTSQKPEPEGGEMPWQCSPGFEL